MQHHFINISSDVEHPFEKSLWIGKGRKYPKNPLDVPFGLINYCNHLLEIPDDIAQKFIPDSSLDIKAFLRYKLPDITFSLPIKKAQCCFSNKTPNENTTFLEHRRIPSHALVSSLKEYFRQAILDGAQSVEDPQFPGSRLPLWCIAYWKEMHLIHDIQQGWRKGMRCIEEHIPLADGLGEIETLRKARLYLENLRWRESLHIPGADGATTSTYTFTAFLSNDSLMNTDHINMMFSYLSDRAEKDELTDASVIIETLRFMHAIEKASSATDFNKPSETYLQRLEERIRRENITALMIPVHMLAEMHWVAIRIDFEEQEIAIGA